MGGAIACDGSTSPGGAVRGRPRASSIETSCCVPHPQQAPTHATASAKRVAAVCGIGEAARRLKVEIIEFNRPAPGFRRTPERTGTVVSPRNDQAVLEADVVINVPKLKAHQQMLVTCGVKNLFGCIPGLRKAEYHRLAPNPRDLGHMLTDIHQAVKVGLHIMDGVIAMQGEGPTAGEVYPAGKILMSRDPLALDTVATAMLGMEIEDIPILLSARERGLGRAATLESLPWDVPGALAAVPPGASASSSAQLTW